MMAITTSNSTRVKPFLNFGQFFIFCVRCKKRGKEEMVNDGASNASSRD
jgi:hypothetical protein